MKKIKKVDKNYVENLEMEKNIKKLTKRNVFERFTVKENILIFSVVLILLIIANRLIQNSGTNSNELNYKDISAEKIIEDSNVCYDREVYWRLDSIIKTILATKISDKDDIHENSDGLVESQKYSINDYYHFITGRYKKNISKANFISKLKNVIAKANIEYSNPIDKIYQYNNSTYYLVKIKSDNDIYIGIDLLSEVNGYYIFYVE